MKRDHALLHDSSRRLREKETPPQSPEQDTTVPASNGETGGGNGQLYRSSGIPSTQTPQDFYDELVKHPNIREILTALAKQ